MEHLEARMIIEILGRPPEHVATTLKSIVEKMGKENGVVITHSKFYEPHPVQDAKDLYTAFVEIEAKFDSFFVLFGIIFAYMPSNVEVLSPSGLKLSNEEISSLGNSLISRLHMYESVAKKLVSDRDVLINKLKSMGVTFPAQQPAVQQQPVPAKQPKKAKNKKAKKR